MMLQLNLRAQLPRSAHLKHQDQSVAHAAVQASRRRRKQPSRGWLLLMRKGTWEWEVACEMRRFCVNIWSMCGRAHGATGTHTFMAEHQGNQMTFWPGSTQTRGRKRTMDVRRPRMYDQETISRIIRLEGWPRKDSGRWVLSIRAVGRELAVPCIESPADFIPLPVHNARGESAETDLPEPVGMVS